MPFIYRQTDFDADYPLTREPPVAKAAYPTGTVLNAKLPTLGCNQGSRAGEEDCLALDIYTPVDVIMSILSVQFW